MSRTVFTTDKVIKLPAPLSNAVRAGNLLFLSGITPFDVDRNLAKGDFPAQMRQTMSSIKTILEEAGSSLDRVVKVTVLLANVEDFRTMFDIYRTYFEEPYPALTTIGSTLVIDDFLLEIECVAELD